MTEEDILKKIGSKLKEIRISRNIKQSEVSERSGVSMFSISQMENGHNSSILTLVKVLGAMDRMDMLDKFLLPPEVDQKLIEEFVAKQTRRKRVIHRKG